MLLIEEGAEPRVLRWVQLGFYVNASSGPIGSPVTDDLSWRQI